MSSNFYVTGAAALLCSVSSASLAQTAAGPAPQASDEAGLEDIVVTATRREESLQSVPIAVTALTAEALQTRQIVDVKAIERSAPNVQISAAAADNSSAKISIRGPIATDTLITIDPSVGIYLDGVYIARSPGANLEFLDLERVEVLRGPQGTLFGRNTIGGALNIVTRKPSDRLEGFGGFDVGNYSAFKAYGALNVPINDKAAFRLSASHNEHGGYARSTVTGAEIQSLNSEFVRAQLRLRPTDAIEVLLAGDYNKSTEGPQWVTIVHAYANGNATVQRLSNGTATLDQFVDPFARRIATTSDSTITTRTRGVSGTVTADVGALTLKSITSYRDLHQVGGPVDLDSTPFVIQFSRFKFMDVNQFSQEVQLFGKVLDDKLDFIVGAYYFREHGTDLLNSTSSLSDGEATNKSQAIYAQATYSVTDRLDLVGGIRQAWDQKELLYRNKVLAVATGAVVRCTLPTAVLPTCAVDLPKRKFSFVPFQIGANYTFRPGLMAYAKWARGFRAGGFNLRGITPFAVTGFNPEQLDSYEVGVKADIGRWLRINTTGYYSDYSGLVLSRVTADPAGGTVSTASNSGDARVYGIEVEATARLGALTLAGSLGTADAKYTRILPGVTTVNLQSPIVLVPKYTANLSADYDIDLGDSELMLHTDVTRRGTVYFSNPLPPAVQIVQRPYNLVNALATWKLADRKLQFSAWVRNLFDKRFLTRGTDSTAAGLLVGNPGDPRTYGLSARFDF